MDVGRLDAAMQRATAHLFSLVPPPLEVPRLGPLRARLSDAIFERHRGEVEAAQRRLLEQDDLSIDLAAPFGLAAAAPLVRVADRMISELRAELQVRARSEGLFDAGLAALDGHMPTQREEFIDRAELSEAHRLGILRGLDRVNRVLGSYVRFLDVLAPLLPVDGESTLLDLASGHGGFPLALARVARSRGLRLRIIASDVRPDYVQIGRRRAEELRERSVEFRVVDAFRLRRTFHRGEIDLITCTQSLHHFGAGGIAALLSESLRSAGRGIAFIDPVRGLQSLLGIAAVTLLATANPRLVHDGVVSVRKSFVPEEMCLIARCVPGGERLESFWLAPGFVALRTKV